jgi:hypothetical protein
MIYEPLQYQQTQSPTVTYVFQLKCHRQGANNYITFLYGDQNTWQ